MSNSTPTIATTSPHFLITVHIPSVLSQASTPPPTLKITATLRSCPHPITVRATSEPFGRIEQTLTLHSTRTEQPVKFGRIDAHTMNHPLTRENARFFRTFHPEVPQVLVDHSLCNTGAIVDPWPLTLRWLKAGEGYRLGLKEGTGPKWWVKGTLEEALEGEAQWINEHALFVLEREKEFEVVE